MDAERRQMRANALAENDLMMLIELVDLRHRGELTQGDVARALGISQQAVSAFEQLESDPRLSTIRQYAHAIGALVAHEVRADTGCDDDLEWIKVHYNASVSSAIPAEGQVLVSREAVASARTDHALAA